MRRRGRRRRRRRRRRKRRRARRKRRRMQRTGKGSTQAKFIVTYCEKRCNYTPVMFFLMLCMIGLKAATPPLDWPSVINIII